MPRLSAQPGSGVTFIAPRTQRARTESAANTQQAEEAKPSTAQPEVPNEQKQVSATESQPARPAKNTDQQAIALWNQKRYSDAVPIFDQACSDGKADSCYHLGLIYVRPRRHAGVFSRVSVLYEIVQRRQRRSLLSSGHGATIPTRRIQFPCGDAQPQQKLRYGHRHKLQHGWLFVHSWVRRRQGYRERPTASQQGLLSGRSQCL